MYYNGTEYFIGLFLQLISHQMERNQGKYRHHIHEPVDLRPFSPISALCEKNNPRDIEYMSPVIFSTCLDIEQKYS